MKDQSNKFWRSALILALLTCTLIGWGLLSDYRQLRARYWLDPARFGIEKIAVHTAYNEYQTEDRVALEWLRSEMQKAPRVRHPARGSSRFVVMEFSFSDDHAPVQKHVWFAADRRHLSIESHEGILGLLIGDPYYRNIDITDDAPTVIKELAAKFAPEEKESSGNVQ